MSKELPRFTREEKYLIKLEPRLACILMVNPNSDSIFIDTVEYNLRFPNRYIPINDDYVLGFKLINYLNEQNGDIIEIPDYEFNKQK
jgi:hypothetical protein